MRRRIINSLPLLAAFVLMVTVSGCVEPIMPVNPASPRSPKLRLQIAVPASDGLLTKAATDTIAGTTLERTLYDIQVWAFEHQSPTEETGDGKKAIQYFSWAPNTTDKTVHRSMPLPDDVMDNVGPNYSLKLDFYVLVNGSSVGVVANSDAAKTLSRGDIKDKVLANGNGSGFGSGTALVTAVPNGTLTEKGKGLPMSGFFNNDGAGFDVSFLHYGFTETQLDFVHGQVESKNPVPFSIDAEGLAATSAQKTYLSGLGVNSWTTLWAKLCPTIPVTRAISKVRFVFAKAGNMTAETKINSVRLVYGNTYEEDILPASTWLFPREDPATDKSIKPTTVTNYESLLWPYSGTDPLVPNSYFKNNSTAVDSTIDTPLRLRKDSEIEGEITSGGVKKKPKDMSLEEYATFLSTEIAAKHALERILYLRESDRDNIHVKINYTIGTGDTAATANAYIPLNTSFTRNTWWTVYTYFMSYELGFEVTVSPWNGVESHGQLEDPELNL